LLFVGAKVGKALSPKKAKPLEIVSDQVERFLPPHAFLEANGV
jgi:hypothetical protein